MSENTMASCLLQMSFPFCNFSSVHPCWRLVADSVEVLASFKSLLNYQEISEVCRTLPPSIATTLIGGYILPLGETKGFVL